jgi:hydroxymethylbilane synthase
MDTIRPSLRLGTRGSPLAIAQSKLIERALRAHHGKLEIDLVTIATAGDRDLTTPLDQVADPGFFSDELDHALLDGSIDFTVHSMKDLDQQRPAGLMRAAIPVRENPRDVILFRGDILDRLRAGSSIRIGSSSARRQHHVARFLMDFLPATGAKPDLQLHPLRGPVDARVARISTDPESPEALDGVVLALAGLARLWEDGVGREMLLPHLSKARWMVLPLSECPAAPAQGALALECRADDARTSDLLSALHDATTAELVQAEIDTWQNIAPSERGPAGVTAIQHASLGPLLYSRGATDTCARIEWNKPAKVADHHPSLSWDGGEWQSIGDRRAIDHELRLKPNSSIFVAHWLAAADVLSNRDDARIWVSGTKSWRELAARGIWVEGCADNLGFADITATLECEVLGLPALHEWVALTKRGAEASWRASGVGQVVATYERCPPPRSDVNTARARVQRATDFFWGSIDQYRAVEAWLPGNARHACGAGKTAPALRAAGIDAPLVFPSRREWREWLR